ncbi:F-box domain-containing protein [Colletotrichum truncatum]|uniref:F-box domain-containing protein n=1 Tax=Colletotrichum truncatum TaxID=5467 RepID=A0ACC3Z4K9_COLTU|nr:F-box domain-containing protein [Colletotrichum truncatum]KAF6788552.1 F-box domain-containing protein [Colletotrichum truncatum]
MFQLTDLPDTLFLEILCYLSPRDIVLHRRVSRASHAALTRRDISQALLHVFFPRSLECRLLRSQFSSSSSREWPAPPVNDEPTPPPSPPADWPRIFAVVSRRYHNLSLGEFHSLTTIPILKDRKLIYPFAPWNRLLRRDGMAMPFQLPDRSWTYDGGVLVYPSPSQPPFPSSSWSKPPVLKALDLCSGAEATVPFDWTDKIVRRVRLAQRVLVVEWAEATGSHPLNERETAHRHFATAFDVRATSSSSSSSSSSLLAAAPFSPGVAEPEGPKVTFRSEWKIHYLGLPLSHQDRIISTHTATHYAVYAHQPTRSPWGEDTPLERLVVWALGAPSPYRPSLDPSSSRKPDADPGPNVILRLTNGDLDHWAVRQRHTPRVTRLVLDTGDDTGEEAKGGGGGGGVGHVYLHEEDHLWIAGPQSSEAPPARHSVRSTGLPLTGVGPRWVDECGAEGDAERSFCPAGSASPPQCRRRGRAPCWRHEEFPYLTVAEVVDSAAGTRVCGRQCFTMETVSVTVEGSCGGRGSTPSEDPPAGDIGSNEVAADADADADSDRDSDAATAGRGEVQFPDDMWRTVMSGAALAGDERWVIGEDDAGDVSVVRF